MLRKFTKSVRFLFHSVLPMIAPANGSRHTSISLPKTKITVGHITRYTAANRTTAFNFCPTGQLL